uniref:F-box domain-containing protein n=1 Tax=Kalanchoe fedtschenkoi TaxID=63787 RepID=A0A7N0ZX30_KALFE
TIRYASNKSAVAAKMNNYQLRPRRGRTYNNYMQPDIMFEIFSRLPIEAIVTCKCVCKTWRGLIEDPYFIERHRHLALYQAPRALIRPRIPDMNVALDMLGRELEVMSTCDGLLCIASDHRQAPVYVYNPVMDRLVKLPSTGMKRKLLCHEVGLIFHESSGSYKVVRGYRFKIKAQEYYRFEMITLGEAAWTELTPPSLIYECHFGRPLQWHGAIHWKIQPARITNSRQSIMSFDIDKEAFQIVYFRDNPPQHNRLQMFVLDDDLVLLDSHNSSLKIWRVEGDVIGGYSIHQYTLMQSYMQWGGHFRCRWISETGRDGTYMLHTTYCPSTKCHIRSNLVNFSHKTGSYTQLNLSRMPEHFSAMAFKPTLVCPVRARVNAPRSFDSQL